MKPLLTFLAFIFINPFSWVLIGLLCIIPEIYYMNTEGDYNAVALSVGTILTFAGVIRLIIKIK